MRQWLPEKGAERSEFAARSHLRRAAIESRPTSKAAKAEQRSKGLTACVPNAKALANAGAKNERKMRLRSSCTSGERLCVWLSKQISDFYRRDLETKSNGFLYRRRLSDPVGGGITTGVFVAAAPGVAVPAGVAPGGNGVAPGSVFVGVAAGVPGPGVLVAAGE